jgi:hypothetical protein
VPEARIRLWATMASASRAALVWKSSAEVSQRPALGVRDPLLHRSVAAVVVLDVSQRERGVGEYRNRLNSSL